MSKTGGNPAPSVPSNEPHPNYQALSRCVVGCGGGDGQDPDSCISIADSETLACGLPRLASTPSGRSSLTPRSTMSVDDRSRLDYTENSPTRRRSPQRFQEHEARAGHRTGRHGIGRRQPGRPCRVASWTAPVQRRSDRLIPEQRDQLRPLPAFHRVLIEPVHHCADPHSSSEGPPDRCCWVMTLAAIPDRPGCCQGQLVLDSAPTEPTANPNSEAENRRHGSDLPRRYRGDHPGCTEAGGHRRRRRFKRPSSGTSTRCRCGRLH